MEDRQDNHRGNPPTSQGLEVVSDKAEGESLIERRRLPRVNLRGEQFRLMMKGEEGKVFSVTDVSREGLAFRILDPADLVLFTVGAEFQGVLNLHATKFTFRARVRHGRRDMVGCQFEWLGPGLVEALGRYLDPQELGRELRPAPPLEGGHILYHGPSGTEVMLMRSIDGQFQRLTVYALGQLVLWDREQGLVTGIARASRETSEVRGVFRYETLLLHRDSSPDARKLEIAKKLLLSSNLPESLVRWAARQLTFS